MSSRSYDLALGLIKLGHEVTLFTNSYCHWTHKEILDQGERVRIEEIDGIQTVWLKTFPYKGNGLGRGINMLSNAFMVLEYSKLLKKKPDSIVGPSVPIITGLAAYILAKKYKSRFIFEVRDVWPIALVDSGAISKWNIIYLIFRAIEKFLYKKAKYISSTLPFIQAHVEASGSDPGKIVWIPNCMSGKNEFSQKENESSKERLKVIYLGGFGQEHDVMNIVNAAFIIKQKEIEDVEFLIYGDGPKKALCIEAASKKGLNNILFNAPVSKSLVQSRLAEADVLVACVIDSPVYKFGINLNKIYDYFLARKPILFAGNTPNNPVKESSSGISLPPENPEALAQAILKFKSMTPQQRNVYGERGFSYAKIHYSQDALASRFEKLIL